jgi:hypothetical protein
MNFIMIWYESNYKISCEVFSPAQSSERYLGIVIFSLSMYLISPLKLFGPEVLFVEEIKLHLLKNI